MSYWRDEFGLNLSLYRMRVQLYWKTNFIYVHTSYKWLIHISKKKNKRFSTVELPVISSKKYLSREVYFNLISMTKGNYLLSGPFHFGIWNVRLISLFKAMFSLGHILNSSKSFVLQLFNYFMLSFSCTSQKSFTFFLKFFFENFTHVQIIEQIIKFQKPREYFMNILSNIVLFFCIV